jgi:hypothetical protein
MARGSRVFGRSDEADAQAPNAEQGNESEGAPEASATPGEAAPDAQPPEEVHQGYSGSGVTNGLHLPTLRKVAPGQSAKEREKAREQEEAKQKFGALLNLVAENSPKGEWVEWDVTDEAEAKRTRRGLNSAAESHPRNFDFVIDQRPASEGEDNGSWVIQGRMARATGAGRPKASTSNGESETQGEAEAEGASQGENSSAS